MITSKLGDDLGVAHSEVSGPGSIFAFLPAHSGSSAGAVAQQLSRTLSEGLGVTVLLADFDRRAFSVQGAADQRNWGAFVSEVDGIPVLNARAVEPRQLGRSIEYARRHFHIVCADLTGARESHAAEILRAADGIFVVTGSDAPSLEGVREKLQWLKSLGLADECGLLLERTPHGKTVAEAEQQTGMPVCSLVENSAQIEQLATWLACNALAASALETAQAV